MIQTAFVNKANRPAAFTRFKQWILWSFFAFEAESTNRRLLRHSYSEKKFFSFLFVLFCFFVLWSTYALPLDFCEPASLFLA